MCEDEHLFLLEFLVDKLYLCNDAIDDMTKGSNMYITKCVTFQCMDFPCMEVCEDSVGGPENADFPPVQDEPGGKVFGFRAGRSCLFAMSGQKLSDSMDSCPVTIIVGRKGDPNLLPDIIPIAQNTLQLNGSLATVVQQVMKDPTKVPTSQTVKDRFSLFNNASKEKKIGWIEALIRLSCFGKLIVTQFQLTKEKCFLFKGNEEDPSSFQCREVTGAEPKKPSGPEVQEKEKLKKCEVITAVLGGHALTIRVQKELKTDDDDDNECRCGEGTEESDSEVECRCNVNGAKGNKPLISADGNDMSFEFPRNGKSNGFPKPKVTCSGIPSVQVDRDKLDINERSGIEPGTKVYEICPKAPQGDAKGQPFNLQLNTGAYSVSMDPRHGSSKGIYVQPQDDRDVTFRLSKTLDTPHSITQFELELRPYRAPSEEPLLDKFVTCHEEIQCTPKDFEEPAAAGKGKKGKKK